MDPNSIQLNYQIKMDKLLDICQNNSLSICLQCILRFLNNRKILIFHNYEQILEFAKTYCSKKDEFSNYLSRFDQNKFCQCCLNILNFKYINDKFQEIQDFISTKVSTDIEDFQLHIFLPLIITLRNLYFCTIFKLDPIEVISVKDSLKSFIFKKIEEMTKAKNVTNGNFVIELTFTHEKTEAECKSFRDFCRFNKRFKSLSDSNFINHTSLLRIFDNDDSKQDIIDRFVLNEVETSCDLKISIRREPIYIAGRYLKFSRNLSQTPWFIEETNFISSVQERIVSGIKKYIEFEDIKFSASGREDVDVRMLGSGRPFSIEILNPQLSISNDVIIKIKQFINDQYQDVKVRDLQFVPKNQTQIFLKEGEQEKSKSYQALCCIDRPFTDEDSKILNSVENLQICQKTPIRVLHRRTLSDRYRTIHRISVAPIDINELDEHFKPFISQIFNIKIMTEAGTYIKEFVHSDFGRTSPNIATLLGNCTADIISLDVLEVKLDWPPAID